MASHFHAGMQSTGSEAGRSGGDLRHHCWQEHCVSMLSPVEGGICLRGALLQGAFTLLSQCPSHLLRDAHA